MMVGYDSPKRRPPALLIDSLSAHYDDEVSGRHFSLGSGEEIPVRRTFIDFGCLIGTPPDTPRKTISTAPARMGGFSIRGAFDSWKVVTTTVDSTSPSNASYTIVAGPPSSTASSTRLTVTTDCSILHDLEQAEDDEIRGKAKRALLSAAKSGTLEDALKRTLKGADELPDVTYRLSSMSMKAAGYWKPQSPRVRSPRSPCSSDPSDPSALLHGDLRKESFGSSSSLPQPVTPPEVLDPAAWAQTHASTGPTAAAWAQLHASFQSSRTAQAVVSSAAQTPPAAAVSSSAQSAKAAVPQTQANPAPSTNFYHMPSVTTWMQRPRKLYEEPPAKPPGDFCMPATAPQQGEAPQRQESEGQVGELDVNEAESSDGDDSSDEDLGLCPTYAPDVPIPSIGSTLHSEASCKRCCFFPKGRCNNGYDCEFCHFAHEKRKPKNKKKKKSKRRKNKNAAGHANIPQAPTSSKVQTPHQPTGQQGFGSCPTWMQPMQQPRPSRLVCHDLQFVPTMVQQMQPTMMPVMPHVDTAFAWSSGFH